jgi:hypothetical protein
MKEFTIGALLGTLVTIHFDTLYAKLIVFIGSF